MCNSLGHKLTQWSRINMGGLISIYKILAYGIDNISNGVGNINVGQSNGGGEQEW